ncbi:lipopolysaccharide biosynthesis protein [Roseivirga sp. BDSF3-8]|uniref:lipopolysaccharide biosynthesis protein n=1 Tax=Roseivirga sp. BDSF3-8 TaxID=3241598 RepID=UPI0035323F68
MSALKKLAGQTALYGVSSILARVFVFFLTPLHTEVLAESEMGIMAKLYAYVAFFNILYTFGMETAYFRFVSRDDTDHDEIYRTTGSVILIISAISTTLLLLNAQGIANWLDTPQSAHLVTWLGIILLFDAMVAIPFASLRQQNRPLKFALIRTISIGVMVALNLLPLYLIPKMVEWHWLEKEGLAAYILNYDRKLDFVFIANLVGSVLVLFMLYKEVLRFRFTLPKNLLRSLLPYAFPIFLMGIAGIANDQLDKILLEELLPADFMPGFTSREVLGIYYAAFKLSVLMVLATQAFRFAGEPFFFSTAKEKDSPQLFARVLHYFFLTSLVLFIGVSLNRELLGSFFLQGEAFKIGLNVVPLLLFAKLFYGVYINLSIWFKLSDRTHYGTWLSLLGAGVTVTGNLALIPVIGYYGSAVAAILCFVSMCVACYYLGQKYYPIPYRWAPLFWHLLAASGLAAFEFFFELENQLYDYTLNILLTIAYIFALYLLERKNLRKAGATS